MGDRLRGLREAQGLTALEAAERSGLGRRTLYRAERGRNPTMATVVRLLRLYGRLDSLEAWLPAAELSPMALLERSRRDRG